MHALCAASQMVELASKKFVCIVDESKLVNGLGGSKGALACPLFKGSCGKHPS
jgi:ribose 5-phosphate isomerase